VPDCVEGVMSVNISRRHLSVSAMTVDSAPFLVHRGTELILRLIQVEGTAAEETIEELVVVSDLAVPPGIHRFDLDVQAGRYEMQGTRISESPV
jgi:hypothetical protein